MPDQTKDPGGPEFLILSLWEARIIYGLNVSQFIPYDNTEAHEVLDKIETFIKECEQHREARHRLDELIAEHESRRLKETTNGDR